ncbi:winged helix-turn-helix transcriptional regulator [Dyadobacter sp. 50-39]|uniref:winged helix-turn-helix transcriptional regulator n=1 Tax=Dyadobacter sp. 50-39 TaxID=1895756 RepID=UPI0038D3569C
MEDNLLLKRSIVSESPVKIEYTLTKYCFRITEVLRVMEKCGNQHREIIMANKAVV